MKWKYMPLICVALLAVALCVSMFFYSPKDTEQSGANQESQNTQPPVPSTDTQTTEPTEPEPTNPVVDPIITNNKKYVGVYINDPHELGKFDNSLNMLGWFDTLDKISTTKIAMCLDECQFTAFITLEPENMELEDIAAGYYDAKIIAYLQELSKGDRVNTELFIRFAHEMETRPTYKFTWYDWQGKDPEVYIAAWKHVVDLGRQYAPNVKWVWSPNRSDEYADKYYPGSDYVDYVGVTVNTTAKYDLTFLEAYETLGKRSFVESYGKPVILSEVANHRYNTQSQKDYIFSAIDCVKYNDNYVGVCFFDKSKNSERQFEFSNDADLIKEFIVKAKELWYHEETQVDQISMDD